jgi:ABC-2 type transport system permease protein
VVTVTIITILEMSLLSYGIIVMRSVLEDKTSRMVEILLCSVTPRALMAGNILGIGGLSLTHVMIRGALAAGGITTAARILGTDLAHSLTLAPARCDSRSQGVSAQIFRVGTLMYGKKPSLREITRWLRYS